MINAFILTSIPFVTVLTLTKVFIRYSQQWGFVAVPNARSSHRAPTPTSGGAVFVGVILICWSVLAFQRVVDSNIVWTLVAGGGLLAVVGFVDDRRSVGVWLRLVVQSLVAIGTLWSLGWPSVISVGASGAMIPLAGVLWFFWILWMSNLYNFMDGIDGLVATQTVVMGFLLASLMGGGDLRILVLVFSSAVAGFLFWNWRPAKIFMGDTGSVFLGYCIAVIALVSEQKTDIPLLVFVLLFAVFIGDATFTTLGRVLRREPWHQAHRGFAYQQATDLMLQHDQVVLRIQLINAMLIIASFFAYYRPVLLPLLLLMAYASLLVLHSCIQRTARLLKAV